MLAGERKAVAIPGFDLGNSPQEFVEPLGETLVFTTTNGTRAILAAAAAAETVLVGSLLNLDAVAAAARGSEDVEVVCAGLQGRFTIDDAYCAGRIAELLGGERSDAAEAAVRLAGSFASAEEGLRASGNPDTPGSPRTSPGARARACSTSCPRLARLEGPAAEIVEPARAATPLARAAPGSRSSAQWAQMQPSAETCSQPGGARRRARRSSVIAAPHGQR